MNDRNRMKNVKHLGFMGLWLAMSALTTPVNAQELLAPTDEHPQGLLRAEIHTSTTLHGTSGPLWVRFTLVNTGDVPVSIGLAEPFLMNAGVTLPDELVLGTPEQPAISFSVDDREPTTIPPPAQRASDEERPGTRELRIAPHGAVGALVDLRQYARTTRYAGRYTVTWAPLGGEIPAGHVSFDVQPRKDAILVTDQGKITFSLAYDTAPENVRNFLELVNNSFYDKKTIHRVIAGDILQGGCPKGNGSGIRPDGRTVRAEFHKHIPVVAGTLLMARRPSDPNSASCQFFVALDRLPELDGQHTVIGQAYGEASMRTLEKLSAVATDKRDRPLSRLTIRSVNLVEANASRVRDLDQPSTDSAATQ